MEELMEAQDLPESDRNEVRRFAEVLKRRKSKREGKPPPPAPDSMKDCVQAPCYTTGVGFG